jgi:hypothetical protein
MNTDGEQLDKAKFDKDSDAGELYKDKDEFDLSSEQGTAEDSKDLSSTYSELKADDKRDELTEMTDAGFDDSDNLSELVGESQHEIADMSDFE